MPRNDQVTRQWFRLTGCGTLSSPRDIFLLGWALTRTTVNI